MATPVVVTRGARESAVLIDSPHSGDIYPQDFRFRRNFEPLRRAEGMYIDSILSFAPALGATLVQAGLPRSDIDVDRGFGDDLDAYVAPGGMPVSNAPEQSRPGMEPVWCSVDGVPVYEGPLSLEEVEARIADYWMPYYSALDEAWFRVIRRCGFGIHLTCLSMPSHSRLYPPELGGEMPYDIVIGNRDNTTAGKLVTRCVVRLLERRGYYVGLNDPYKGTELVRKLGAPKERRHSLQIDINRRLFMDEQSLEPTTGLLDVQRDMAYLLGYLIDYSAELA